MVLNVLLQQPEESVAIAVLPALAGQVPEH